MTKRDNQFVFLCLFFVSGACGLIYEIVWSRLLVLVFGGTTFAITTVLGCFMGGLALGSYAAGRISHRVERPARFYGLLEIGIGVYCLFIPMLFHLAVPMYQGLATISSQSFYWLTVGRTLVCGLILLVPTCFMGATLPLLSKAFAQRRSELGGAVARLYGFNTIGAFVGCTAAGFLLLPLLGLSNSILLAAILNISAGLVAVTLTTRSPKQADHEGVEEPDAAGKEKPALAKAPAIDPGLLLFLYGLSGFAAMAYQIAWTRALILSMGASTYAFSAIVACFILGIALGSLAISRRMAKIRAPLALAGLLEGLIGLSALVVVPLFGEMPGLVKRLCETAGRTFEYVLAIEVLSVFGLLMIPTLCMGALMPLVCATYQAARAQKALRARGTRDGAGALDAGRIVGAVYASNSVGTIIGSVVTGFVLIPWSAVGMQRTIILASLLSGGIATVFVLSQRSRRKSRVPIALPACWLAGIALISVTQPWSKWIMVSGPYLGRGGRVDARSTDVLFYREGIDTTVAVTRAQNALCLRVNGKPDASDKLPDVRTMMLTAHIPLLLRPDAEEVCIIGLGAGITTGAALAHPVKKVDCAEISGAVVAAAEHFSKCNNDALRDPRLAVHRADGRNFLLMSDAKYDVISSEPSNVWISGIANLFTREFFELARDRLKPGGLHCQWVQAYSMKTDDFVAIIKTVSSVFRHVQLWHMSFQDYLIVCSDDPIVIDVESMYLTFQRPAVGKMLSSILLNDPIQLAYHYVADGRHLESWMATQEPLTDNLPRLEFSAPRHLYRSEIDAIEKTLSDISGVPDLAGSKDSLLNSQFLARLLKAREAKRHLSIARTVTEHQEGYECFRRMAQCAPFDWRMIEFMVRTSATARMRASDEERSEIDRLLAKVAKIVPWLKYGADTRPGRRPQLLWPLGQKLERVADPQFESMMAQAKALSEQGKHGEALEIAKKTVTKFPDSLIANRQTGIWALEAEGAESAIPYLLRALSMRPALVETNFQLACAYGSRGDRERALAFLEKAITNGLNDLGRIKSNDYLAPLHEDDRFQQLLVRVNARPRS